MGMWHRQKRYILFVGIDNTDMAKNYILDAGCVIHTLVTVTEYSGTKATKIAFEGSRRSLRKLKRRIYDRTCISNSCYRSVGYGCYERLWAKTVYNYTLPAIDKYKPDFGYKIQ